MSVPFNRTRLTQADCAAVQEAMDSGWLTDGPYVRRFEEAVAAYTGYPQAVAVCHGTCALHLVFAAHSTYEVRMLHGNHPYGPAVRNAIPPRRVYGDGALPLWVDASWFGEPVRAQPPAMTVFDAARCLGAPLLRGHLAVILSFHPLKTITTGEGGMVLTSDATLAEDIRSMAHQGHGNYRMTEMQAALGWSQLQRIEQFLERRREIARSFHAEGLLKDYDPESAHNCLPFWCNDPVKAQTRFAEHGIETKLPQELNRRVKYLLLPVFPDMTGAELAHLLESTKRVKDELRTAAHAP